MKIFKFLKKNKIKKNENKSFNVNILMMGGSRCGKTSVLACMKDCFDNQFGTTNLTINVESAAAIIDLDDKRKEMADFYKKDKSETFFLAPQASKDKREHEFSINLKSKPGEKIKFNFFDFPGEWLKQNEKIGTIKELITKSHVIIIAVDTPYLMEHPLNKNESNPGMYNELRNQPKKICDLLKSGLNLDEFPKMILFVPLKCEKYKNENNMHIVSEKIKLAYKFLFDHIDNKFNRTKCVLAITPIYTMGTVEFKRFKRDTLSRKMIIDSNTGLPLYPLYGFTDGDKSSPKPLYCEQPVVYVLLYVLTTAKKILENNPKWKQLGRYLFQHLLEFPSIKDYLNEINLLKRKLVLNEQGFELICDPLEMRRSG